VGSLGAHPQPTARSRASSTRYDGFRAAGAVRCPRWLPLATRFRRADRTAHSRSRHSMHIVSAFGLLDRQDIAAPGAHARHSLLCRRHSDPAGAHAPPACRGGRIGARRKASPRRPRSTAPMRCCCPSRKSWSTGPRAADEPEIIGDPALVTAGDTPHPLCSPSSPGSSRQGERHGSARRCIARARRQLRHDGDDARRPHHRAEGQVVGGRAILRLRE